MQLSPFPGRFGYRVSLSKRSRLVNLPGKSTDIRTHSAVSLLIFDEVAYITEDS
jgi:hypothetical protein